MIRLDKKWQTNFSLKEKNCQRTSNFELDFLFVISIKWSSLVIELNEVSGFVEMNALVKRSALVRHYDPNPIFQSESITDSQCSGQLRCLNVNWEAVVSFRIQTGLHNLIHGLTKGWQRKPPKWKLAGRVEMILLLFQAPFHSFCFTSSNNVYNQIKSMETWSIRSSQSIGIK